MATKIILKDKTELIIDSTLSRGKSISVRMTEHPIEDSTLPNITDHVILEPQKFKLTGKLSDVFFPSDTRLNKYNDIDSLLSATVASGDLVTLETKNDTFKNLKILSYSSDESTGTGNTYNISLDFQEVFFANAKMTTIKKTSKAPNKQAIGRKKSGQKTGSTVAKTEIKKTQDKFSTKVSKGKKSTKPATTKQKSILNRGLSWISNLTGAVLPIN